MILHSRLSDRWWIGRRRMLMRVMFGVGVAVAICVGVFLVYFNPRSVILPPRSPAKWIVFPTYRSISPRAVVTLDAVFDRSIDIDQVSGGTILRLCAFRDAQVKINGHEVELSSANHWKQLRSSDVSSTLRRGSNHIQITVKNNMGPPALWLSIESQGQGVLVVSDNSWQVSLAGSPLQSAKLAGNRSTWQEYDPSWPAVGSLDALRHSWLVLILTIIFSGCLWGVWHWLGAAHWSGNRQMRWLSIMGGLAWAALFVNNTNFLDLSVGYDAKDHLAYVQFLMSHARLPLPSDGWEMNQPPLYYMIVAAAHQLLSLDIGSFSSVAAFRCIGLLAGLAQLFFVGQSLQLIFPRHPRRCLVGMLVAICIPANLYLYQYPTNELLLATLASASVFCALRLLCLHRVNMATFIALGLCLGGALLVKVSGIVVCTAVMLTLIARCVLRGHRRCSMGIMMVASCAILISGWYYYHTWQLTGSLWVGNQDPRSGFAWWQDPGYISATYYLHFGHVFVEPFYSGVVSLWDGLFATLWGDGLVGGRKNLRVGPPWNYSWMTLGYLLAVGPTLMGFAGLVLAVRRFIRRPSWAWCLLLLLSAMMFMIIVAYNLLQQSYYHSAKAFYGLSALIPLCACIGWGADELISRLRLLKIPVVILLLSWAMVSYASFWIRPSTAPTQIHLAMQQVQKHNLQNAQDHLARALEHDPDNLHAMMARITLLINTRPPDTRKVLKLTEQMLQASPNHAEAYWLAAQIYSVAGMRDDAIVYAQRAAELAPEFKEIHLFLAQTYALAGSLDKAAASCHLALKSSPADGPAHQLLGKIYRAMGDTQAADKHAGYLAAIRKAREFLPAMR